MTSTRAVTRERTCVLVLQPCRCSRRRGQVDEAGYYVLGKATARELNDVIIRKTHPIAFGAEGRIVEQRLHNQPDNRRSVDVALHY
jgi:hypothetical protein